MVFPGSYKGHPLIVQCANEEVLIISSLKTEKMTESKIVGINDAKSQCYQTLKPKVIAAIPCYRTERYVRDVVSRAKKYVDQVIVVDDGSDDGTGEMAREAGALVIRHEKNRGKGAAMKTAVQNSDADIVVFLDSDGQHNPDEIPELIEPIIQGRADLVIGSRHLPGSQIASPSFKRRLTNTLASIIISIVISVLLPLACG